jgi:hypothetical protein
MSDYVSLENIPPVSDFRVLNKATESEDPRELERLSKHSDPNVVARVAENINTPIPILEWLADYNGVYSIYIKSYLIRNPRIHYNILHKLMTVESKQLRQKVLYKLLEGYKFAKVELTGEEVHTLLSELKPENMSNLDFIELLETIHEIRDEELKKKK